MLMVPHTFNKSAEIVRFSEIVSGCLLFFKLIPHSTFLDKIPLNYEKNFILHTVSWNPIPNNDLLSLKIYICDSFKVAG